MSLKTPRPENNLHSAQCRPQNEQKIDYRAKREGNFRDGELNPRLKRPQRASHRTGGSHGAAFVYERRLSRVGVTKSPQLDVRKASVGGRQRGGMVEPELGPELFVKG